MMENVRPASAGLVSKHWLDMRPAVRRPACRVLLVAHGGAGPSVFWPMVQSLPEDWGALGLCLPGRDRRALEDPEWSPEHTAAEAALELLDLLAAVPDGAPLIVAGQCMGAWLGYLVLVHGGAELQSRCERFIVFSQKPPHAPRSASHANDDSEQLWQWLESSGMVPAQVARDLEIRELLEPVMRADQATLGLFPTSVPPIECRIDALVGERDPGFERLVPEEWSRYTPHLRVLRLPYAHLLTQDGPERCAEIVVQGIPAGETATP